MTDKIKEQIDAMMNCAKIAASKDAFHKKMANPKTPNSFRMKMAIFGALKQAQENADIVKVLDDGLAAYGVMIVQEALTLVIGKNSEHLNNNETIKTRCADLYTMACEDEIGLVKSFFDFAKELDKKYRK